MRRKLSDNTEENEKLSTEVIKLKSTISSL